MTTEQFDRALNGICPELIAEAAEISPYPKHNLFRKYAAAAAVLAVCIAGGVFAVCHSMKEPRATDTAENSALFGGISGRQEISSETPTISGTAFTDDEITGLLEANKEHIAFLVSAEYGKFGETVQICKQGYYHYVCGEHSGISLNVLTLPVCIDYEIVANIEVYRSGGEILYSLNVGGDKWRVMNEAVNYADNIAFVFTGFGGECAVAPDNTVFEITHGAKSGLTAGYDLISADYNTFSRAFLQDSRYYVTASAAPENPSGGQPKTETTTASIEETVRTETTLTDSPEIAVKTTEQTVSLAVTTKQTLPQKTDTTVQTEVSQSTSAVITTALNPMDGSVSVIGSLMEQMGKQPIRLSKKDAETLLGIVAEMQPVPAEKPVFDPLNTPYGGGYVLYVDGGSRYENIGNGYLLIDGRYYYDSTGKADELDAEIGNMIFKYEGAPK